MYLLIFLKNNKIIDLPYSVCSSPSPSSSSARAASSASTAARRASASSISCLIRNMTSSVLMRSSRALRSRWSEILFICKAILKSSSLSEISLLPSMLSILPCSIQSSMLLVRCLICDWAW